MALIDTLGHLKTYIDIFRHMSSHIEIIRHCLYCGNAFSAKTLVTRYCSHTCNSRHYKQIKREEKLDAFKEEQAQKPKTSVQTFHIVLQQKEFLSIEETAALIGASRRTIFRLIASNQIKVSKVGRRSIIKRSEIDQLFK